MRTIHLSNEKKRDAQVGFELNRRKSKFRSVTADGNVPVNCRILKSTMATEPDVLLKQFDNLSDAIIQNDPEIDMEQVGRKLADLQKVYLDGEGKPAKSVTLTDHLEFSAPAGGYFGAGAICPAGSETPATTVSTQRITRYNVWLGETQVTNLNCADIFGDGRASYDVSTGVLTLKNGKKVDYSLERSETAVFDAYTGEKYDFTYKYNG